MVSPSKPFVLISFPRDMEYLCDEILQEFERLKMNFQDQNITTFSWNIDIDPLSISNTKPAQEYIPLATHPLCKGVICLFGELLGRPLKYDIKKELMGVDESELVRPYPVLYPDNSENLDTFPITGSVYECLTTWKYNQDHNFQEGVAIPMLIVVIGEKSVLNFNKPDEYHWGNSRWQNANENRVEFQKNKKEFHSWMMEVYYPEIQRLFNFLKYLNSVKNTQPAFDNEPEIALKRIRQFLLDTFGNGKNKGIKPFKGLKYYNEDDSSIFFGREQQIQDVLSKFSGLWGGGNNFVPFFSIYGGSGVGKSSFLRAGLIARLRKRNHYGDFKTIVVLSDELFNISQKHKNPLMELYANLMPELNNQKHIEEAFINRLTTREPKDQAISIKEKILEEVNTDKLVIAIDQFEYLIDLRNDEEFRGRLDPLFYFFEEAVKSKRIGLIVTCQTNRLELLVNDPILGEVSDNGGRKTLKFDSEQLEEIVTKSFEISDVKFEDKLIAEILKDLDGFLDENQSKRDNLLPIISNTLDLFYEKQRSKGDSENKTELSITSEIKDIKTIDVKDLIDQLAEKAIVKAKEELGFWDDEILTILLRKLVRIQGANEEQLILLKAEVDKNKLEKKIVQCLKEFRLLISIDTDYVQFVHEAVIRYWKKAFEWLQRENKLLHYEGIARINAINWEKNKRSEDYLFTSGKIIDDFAHLLYMWVSFYHRYENELEPGSLSVKDFIFSSLEKANTPYALVKGEQSNINHFLLATYYGRKDLMKMYLENDKNVIKSKSTKNSNAVYFATFSKSIETLEIILSSGGDPSFPKDEGWYPIHIVAQNGDKEAFNKLLDFKANPLVVNDSNVNILHLVCGNGDDEMFDHILQKVSSFKFNETRTENGWTALHHAAYSSAHRIVKKLLQVPEVNVNIQDIAGWTPLMLACRNAALTSVHAFLDSSKPIVYNLKTGGWSALHLACRYTNGEVVERILSKYNDNINEPTVENTATWKPIHLAIFAKSVSVVEVLLKNQHIIHHYSDNDESLYKMAIKNGSYDILKVLWEDEKLRISELDAGNRAEVLFEAIENVEHDLVTLMIKGIDYHVKNRNGTLLHAAVRSGSMKMIKLIAEEYRGVSLINVTDSDGDTPLHLALERRNYEFFQLLIQEYHAEIIPNRRGYTLLHNVIGSEDDLTLLRLILRARPSLINYRDQKQRNLLHLAIRYKSLEVIKFLLDEGLKIEEKDGLGRTSLHYLARYGNIETNNILNEYLSSDRELKLIDNNGLSPLHLCCQLGNLELIQTLPFSDSAYSISAQHPNLTPIEMAFEAGQETVIYYFIEQKGVDFLFKNMNEHPLVLLIRNSHFKTANDLISQESKLTKIGIPESKKIELYQYLVGHQNNIDFKDIIENLVNKLNLLNVPSASESNKISLNRQMIPLELRFSIKDTSQLRFTCPNDYQEEKLDLISRKVKQRDFNSCQFCGFSTGKYLEIVIEDFRFNDFNSYYTACHFCSQYFCVDFVKEFRSAVLIWLPEIEAAKLNHIMRDIYVGRLRPEDHQTGVIARKALDFLMSRKNLAKEKIGTYDPADLTPELINSNVVKDNIRLMPLDRKIMWEADLEFNQFPSILAHWRSKDGPYFGGVDKSLDWLNDFYSLMKIDG